MAAVVRGSCHPRARASWSAGERGPGGGERGQHGERVGPPVLADAGVGGGLAAVRQQRFELGNQVGRMDVEAAGDLDEDLHRPVEQRRVRAADLVRVDAEQVAQLPCRQPGVAQPLGQRRACHPGPPLIHRGRAHAMGRGGVIVWSWPVRPGRWPCR
jgi:hypothetical protein